MRAVIRIGPLEHPARVDATIQGRSRMPGFFNCVGDNGKSYCVHHQQIEEPREVDMAQEKIERLYQKFGLRLANLRTRTESSQKDVAKRLKMARSNLANIEQGRQRVLLHQIPMLAKALQCHPEDLLEGIVIRNPS